uniref:pentapeptide repeat-containing protein n=1 Tax=Nocardia suismassiliense TaxID=2077092 RepID=UPI003F49730A
MSPLRRIGRTLHTALVWPGWMNVASMLTTVAAIGALWFTNNTLRVTQDQARATEGQLVLSQRTAVTDMFQKAVEMLRTDAEPGTMKGGGIDSRIAGVHLLERMAAESPRDRVLAYQTLAAFVRTRSPLSECKERKKIHAIPDDQALSDAASQWEEQSRDVAEAVEVIGKRDRDTQTRIDDIDLRSTCLPQRILDNFAYVNLLQADLTGASLAGADLTGANLSAANLAGVTLANANLTGAEVNYADLTRANLHGANLAGANLAGANLNCAEMGEAVLSDADLTGIFYTPGTRWPPGFTPPPSSSSYDDSDPKCE